MESAHPFPLEPGGRLLAAIAFTDVVSFSVRVRENEGPTLLRLEEDFVVMRRYCEESEGSVLKSTGDGLLLFFPSAVQAVRCALRIQRAFAARPDGDPENRPLRHRIGVHLGDVFVKDDDVMGDGVNVAARLQGAADPGGICISQTVLDVVKGKVEIEVDRLVGRDVKGAAAIGPMYRVLLAARKVVPVPVEYRPPAPVERPLVSGAGKWMVLAIVVAGVIFLGRYLLNRHQEQRDALAATPKSFEMLDQESKRAAAEASAAAPSAAAVEFDFLALAAEPAAEGRLGAEQRARAQQLAVVAEKDLLAWLTPVVARAQRNAPLPLEGATGVYLDARGRYVIGSRNMTVMMADRTWEELTAAEREKIIVGALNYAAPAPSRAVADAAAAYAYRNKPAPALVAALQRKR